MKDAPLLHQVVKAVGGAHRLQPLCQVSVLFGIGPLYLPLECMCIPAACVLLFSCACAACQVKASQEKTLCRQVQVYGATSSQDFNLSLLSSGS